MAFLNRFLPILSLLSLTGCYQDFTPEIDTREVLCINALVTAGAPLNVKISHTRVFTDETDTDVHDANIMIYVNGVPAIDGYIPAEGDHVRIVAESAVYGRAEAEVDVPIGVSPATVEWHAAATGVTQSDVEGWDFVASVIFDLSLAMTINDPADVANYYNISWSGEWPSINDGYYDEWGDPLESVDFTMGELRYKSEPLFSENIGLLESVTGADAEGFTFFTDRQFPGKSYTLHLNYDNMRYSVRMINYDESVLDCKFTVTLYTVSASFYNWANYFWQLDWGLIGDLGNIGLGEPVAGYSNVSTGAGVVAARAERSFTVNLSDFLKQTFKDNGNREL